MLHLEAPAARPKLGLRALARWLPPLAVRGACLVSAYLVPGRVAPRLREATMLGVTSINRCAACEHVHRRWARATGLDADHTEGFAPDEAEAYAFGQAMAVRGPDGAAPPASLRARHRCELRAVAMAAELASLAGNRAMPWA